MQDRNRHILRGPQEKNRSGKAICRVMLRLRKLLSSTGLGGFFGGRFDQPLALYLGKVQHALRKRLR
jgi:hypothetical protein